MSEKDGVVIAMHESKTAKANTKELDIRTVKPLFAM
jgi:hypothetical protein